MRERLLNHARRYPLWQVEDLYKLIHQAALGSEHAITDEAGVREYLQRELSALGPGLEEPLIDPISPDGALVRVHLRPFARLGGDGEALLAAFLRTPDVFAGEIERVESYATEAIRLAREGRLTFRESNIHRFFERRRAENFPVVHHSEPFERAYRPAYRVVARALLPAVLHTFSS